MRKLRWAAIFCIALVLLGALAGLIYVRDAYPAQPAAIEAMAGSTQITVTQAGTLTFFSPPQPTAGLIFYPGGKVEPEAYAPLLTACAQRGLLCVLVSMPGNLAVLHSNAADGIQARYPALTHWYLCGHSLGGAMAASYIAKHPADYDGLILLAAYSAADLRETGLRVLSVRGSEDGVLDRDKYAAAAGNLPPGAEEYVIEGGCHAYFGDYGPQAGDGTPAISCDAQIRQTADRIAAFTEE
ncbi:MAG: alpha/beta hydrolase [Clostridia bacterium]|nr:alpha/beta hydrolase [Clostridia bacterium]